MNDPTIKICVALLYCALFVRISAWSSIWHCGSVCITFSSSASETEKLGTWRKPFSKWTIWGCLGHVIDFCNVALKPSLHMDSILIRYLLITRSEVFPVFATVARLSGTSEPGPVVLAAHQGCISTYTTPLWSLHASLRRGKSLKFWTKRGWVFEKTKAPSPEVHGVGTLLFLIASPPTIKNRRVGGRGRGEEGFASGIIEFFWIYIISFLCLTTYWESWCAGIFNAQKMHLLSNLFIRTNCKPYFFLFTFKFIYVCISWSNICNQNASSNYQFKYSSFLLVPFCSNLIHKH